MGGGKWNTTETRKREGVTNMCIASCCALSEFPIVFTIFFISHSSSFGSYCFVVVLSFCRIPLISFDDRVRLVHVTRSEKFGYIFILSMYRVVRYRNPPNKIEFPRFFIVYRPAVSLSNSLYARTIYYHRPSVRAMFESRGEDAFRHNDFRLFR